MRVTTLIAYSVYFFITSTSNSRFIQNLNVKFALIKYYNTMNKITWLRIPLKAALSVFILSISIANAFSQWSTSSSINTAVCTLAKNQQNLNVVTDGKGGVIVAWEDSRNSAVSHTDIYIQRIDKNGFAKWAANGVAICSHDSDQAAIGVVADGKGGAIVVWGDTRNGKKDIYGQKIDSTGVVQWAANGVVICMKAEAQSAPKLVGDGSGGAIVVWEDSLAANPDIYAQRISSAGATMWASGGVAICVNVASQNNPRITPDSVGGAIIVWQDFRNGTDYDVYAQRVNPSGSVQWTANGVVVCNAAGTQNNPKIKPDGSSGAIIAWVDKRNGVDHDIYAQRLNASGAVQWAANGIVICNATGSQSAIAMTTYGISGAIISWKDFLSVSSDVIYAQKIDLNGSVAWTANGVAIATGTLSQKNVSISGDGSGGAILVWQDSSIGQWNVKSQKVDAGGTIKWTAGGVATGTAAFDQIYPDNVSDMNGGCVFVFQDKRNALDFDIYAHHLDANGSAANGINEENNYLFSKCFPNPFSSSAVIEISLFNQKGNVDFSVYDVLGAKVEFPFSISQNKINIYRGDIQNGIYFYKINTGDNAISKGTLILTDK